MGSYQERTEKQWGKGFEVAYSCANCKNIWSEKYEDGADINYNKVLMTYRGYDIEVDSNTQRMDVSHTIVASTKDGKNTLSCRSCGSDKQIYIISRKDLT
ncbi:MAG: hypothetical protein ABH950_05155 [Candidatus Altiarchaeota archaeon]